jgi:hypothetical protein
VYNKRKYTIEKLFVCIPFQYNIVILNMLGEDEDIGIYLNLKPPDIPDSEIEVRISEKDSGHEF